MEDFVALFCRKYQWPVQMVMMLMEKWKEWYTPVVSAW